MTRLFGKTILFTDQSAWSSEDIVLGHRGQYKLEDGFRTMKDSEACCWWPMHHRTDQKIRVHGFFCVMALLLVRSEEHTSELQSRLHLVCRLLLEKKNDPTS